MSFKRKNTTATASGWPGFTPEALVLAACLVLFPAGGASASGMVEVSAGPFLAGDGAGGGVREAVLPAFFIDRDEVTNREFAKRFPAHAYPEGAAEHPASGMTWQEAGDYCAALGKRLPRPDEWEKAARGGDGRLYPWGDRHPKKTFHPFFSGVVKRRAGLDRLDVSVYGPRAMAGSLWEWTDEEREGRKAARGGLWTLHLDHEYSKIFERIFLSPGERFIFVGFRCARGAP